MGRGEHKVGVLVCVFATETKNGINAISSGLNRRENSPCKNLGYVVQQAAAVFLDQRDLAQDLNVIGVGGKNLQGSKVFEILQEFVGARDFALFAVFEVQQVEVIPEKVNSGNFVNIST